MKLSYPHALPAPLAWQSFLLCWVAGILAGVWPYPAICVVFFILAFMPGLRRPAALAVAILCFAIGNVFCNIRLESTPPSPFGTSNQSQENAPSIKKERLCGQIAHIQGLPDRRLRITLGRIWLQNHDSPKALPGNAVWTWENPDHFPLEKQVTCVSARIAPIMGFSNFSVPARDVYWRKQGILWRLWSNGSQGNPRFEGRGSWLAQTRNRLMSAIANSMSSQDGYAPPHLTEGQAIVMALIFGDRFHIPGSLADAFGDATLAHSLALSGQHLGIAILLGFFFARIAGKIYPRLYLFMPCRDLALLAACPFALCYLWLGNSPPSLLRAALMLFILTFLVLRKKPASATDLIFLALLCLSVADPLNVFDTGLQLSFLCVTIIAISLPWLRALPGRPGRAPAGPATRIYGYLLQVLFISAVIQIALTPVNLMLFHRIGLYFPLNLLWIPVSSLLVIPLAASALPLHLLHLDKLCSMFLDMAATPCQWLADFLARLQHGGWLAESYFLRPHWTSTIGFAAIMAAFALIAPSGASISRKKIKTLLLAGLVMLYIAPALRISHYFTEDLRLDAYDVGQGQAIALTGRLGRRIVLDGGGSFSRRFDPGKSLLAPALANNAAPRLAAALNSHPDQDHLGGIFYLLDHFKVDALIHNGRDAAGAQKERWRKARANGNALRAHAGQFIQMEAGDYSTGLEILHPPRNGEAWTGNNASIVTRLVRNGKGLALFMGDAELPLLRSLLAGNAALEAKVLVAPHHGSDSSFLDDLYERVRPELVLICCGFANRYNYPGKKLRKYLKERGIRWLDTGSRGQISVFFTKDGEMRIICSRI